MTIIIEPSREVESKRVERKREERKTTVKGTAGREEEEPGLAGGSLILQNKLLVWTVEERGAISVSSKASNDWP